MDSKTDRHGRVLELIGRVYDAAADERLWPAMAPRIAQAFDCASTGLQTRDTRRGDVELLSLTANYDTASLKSYATYYAERDVWVERAAKVGPSKLLTSQDIITDEEFERTEIYNDFCRHLDLFYVVGSVFPVGPDTMAGLGIHRPRNAGPFGEADKAAVSLFLPHLQRALQIRERLRAANIERQATLEGLERSATATLVVSRDGRVLYANALAERLLREGDAILASRGRIASRARKAGTLLACLIRDAADAAAGQGKSPGGTVSIRRDDRLPLTVLVAPLRPARDGFGSPIPAAIVFARDPEQLTPMSAALRGLFGLTSAEAKIASAVAEGKSIEDLAADLRIGLSTARTHLARIFSKTGTNRQPQLVSLILRSVAVLAKI